MSRRWWGLLLVALVTAQTLGLVHRVAHTPGQVQHVSEHGQDRHGHDWVDAVFAGHEGDAECRLYDQLNASGVVPAMPASVLPMAIATHVLRGWQGEALARWVALFDARGPPKLR